MSLSALEQPFQEHSNAYGVWGVILKGGKIFLDLVITNTYCDPLKDF